MRAHAASFRTDIEGLRGIAVLAVVAFHCGLPGAAAGFIGVDVFFVLSGYLITGLLVREVEGTGRLDLRQFYARRMRRLLPAAALVVLFTLAVTALILAPQEITRAGRAARASSIYLTNVFFAVNAADYFSAKVHDNPILHMWSLAVEEQFYLFWPLLIIVGLKAKPSRQLLVVLMALVTVVSFVLSVRLSYSDPTWAFYSLPTRAWEFGVGGLAVLLPIARWRRAESGYRIIGWGGLLTIALAVAVHLPDVPFPGWLALPPVLGTAAVMVSAAAIQNGGLVRVLGSAPLQFLGTHSYSWYLWHWPFLVFAAVLLPSIGPAGKATAAVVSLVVAVVAHRFVENPLRFHPGLVARPLGSLAFGATLSLLMLAGAQSTMGVATWLVRQPTLRAIVEAEGAYADISRSKCVTSGRSTEVKTCTFGSEQAGTTLVLFGDSHALQWFNAYQSLVESRGWRLVTVVKSGCSAYDYVRPSAPRSGEEAGCRDWRTAAVAEIIRIKPTMVIVGSATILLRWSVEENLELWRAGANRTFREFQHARIRVVAMRDTPWPRFDVPTCLARAMRNAWYPGSCTFDRHDAVAEAIFEAERAAARESGDVGFLDMTDVLCDPDGCRTMRDGVVMYSDDHHLTGTFARSLAPVLGERLGALSTVAPAAGAGGGGK
ncbi:MAG TPA: acyltransferase family protein [Vicinamibacterales bacterium]